MSSFFDFLLWMRSILCRAASALLKEADFRSGEEADWFRNPAVLLRGAAVLSRGLDFLLRMLAVPRKGRDVLCRMVAVVLRSLSSLLGRRDPRQVAGVDRDWGARGVRDGEGIDRS